MKATQGRRLIAALKKKAHTYLEMQMLCISTSPQKRIMESILPKDRLVKGKRGNLVTWRVVRKA